MEISNNIIRKKIDNRIRIVVENAVRTKHRSFFVVIGDRGRNHIPNLHYMLRKAGKANPTILWTYKKELAIHSSSRRKRQREERKEKIDPLEESYEVFLSQTTIRYCFYKETYRILGNTFGMLILQDFEALTPNLLARTIETVEGGGMVVLLINSLPSLQALYTMTMDIHARYRTAKHLEIIPRFNERFLLSFGTLANFLAVDDELNVIPFTSGMEAVDPVDMSTFDGHLTERERELMATQQALKDNPIIGPLVGIAKTCDQAKLVMDLMAIIVEKEKSMRTTAVITAARGRGKSAALGIVIAGAVQQGFSNIFVTAPSPENLKAFFFFVVRGLEEMQYREMEDFEIHRSTNPEFNKAVVRINVFKEHRQTIQYLAPTDSLQFAQAELVVIDEAAAIPLPAVEKMFGPYMIFMSSTVNGYEGTGRSLSLKLIHKLRSTKATPPVPGGNVPTNTTELTTSAAAADGTASSKVAATPSARELVELKLEEPIRYSEGDPVEKWLNKVLCLDTAESLPKEVSGPASCPHPDKCELYYVNRDTLFSFHAAAEEFLQRLMGLYVSSHYKNQPDDLQLLSDAPAHHLFVLLPPMLPAASSAKTRLPEILAVIQVCEEGGMSANVMENNLNSGIRPKGDLVPYTLSQQFQEPKFAILTGMRVIRIAVHPDYQRMKYGSRALQLLIQYYNGEIVCTDEKADPEVEQCLSGADRTPTTSTSQGSDAANVLSKRSKVPHLLQPLGSRGKVEDVQYISTCFGVTLPLFEFWKKNGLTPMYIRQGQNDLTGEHSMIMVRVLTSYVPFSEWLPRFRLSFHRRFLSLLSVVFRDIPVDLALSVVLDVAGPTRLVFNTSLASALDSTTEAPSVEKSVAEDPSAIATTTTTTSSSSSSSSSSSFAFPCEPSTDHPHPLLITPGVRVVGQLDPQTQRYVVDGIPQLIYEDLAIAGIHREDIDRLDAYVRMKLDVQAITDLIPILARLYFEKRMAVFPNGTMGVQLRLSQAAVLLGMGLQLAKLNDLATPAQLNLGTTLVSTLLYEALRGICKFLRRLKAYFYTRQDTDQEVPASTILAVEDQKTQAKDTTGTVFVGGQKGAGRGRGDGDEEGGRGRGGRGGRGQESEFGKKRPGSFEHKPSQKRNKRIFGR